MAIGMLRALAAVAALGVVGASAPLADAGVAAARPGRSHAAAPAPVVVILHASGSMNISLPTTQLPSATGTTSVPPAWDRSGSGDVAGWIAGSIGAAALLIAGTTWVWSHCPGARRR